MTRSVTRRWRRFQVMWVPCLFLGFASPAAAARAAGPTVAVSDGALADSVTSANSPSSSANPSRAQEPRSALERAWVAYNNLDYDLVRPLLNQAEKDGIDERELLDFTILTALIQAVYENREASIDAFERVLSLDPDYQPPAGSSPKIESAFLKATTRHRLASLSAETQPMELEQASPSKALWERWWFWPGTAVLGGALIAGVVLFSVDRYPDRDLGPLELP